MSSLVHVAIHPSQFPDAVRGDLLASLRTRQVNHKFHYDSVKQTQQWLALHAAYSPTRTDDDCAATYDRAFAAVAFHMDAELVGVVGLGCGGGQKDTRLLNLLQKRGKTVSYVPCDVSSAMTLVARETALAAQPLLPALPFVCDLASAADLPSVFDELVPYDTARLYTFFGMIPNFEPALILPRLASLLRPGDQLLFSANLAPGADYAAGVQRILPQYDNPLTRDWLLTFLLDLGVERGDGDLRFTVEESAATGLKRIEANFHFQFPRPVTIGAERIEFAAGETIRLFFSYRYTPSHVHAQLTEHGLRVCDQWLAKSDEEAVFLVARA